MKAVRGREVRKKEGWNEDQKSKREGLLGMERKEWRKEGSHGGEIGRGKGKEGRGKENERDKERTKGERQSYEIGRERRKSFLKRIVGRREGELISWCLAIFILSLFLILLTIPVFFLFLLILYFLIHFIILVIYFPYPSSISSSSSPSLPLPFQFLFC